MIIIILNYKNVLFLKQMIIALNKLVMVPIGFLLYKENIISNFYHYYFGVKYCFVRFTNSHQHNRHGIRFGKIINFLDLLICAGYIHKNKKKLGHS